MKLGVFTVLLGQKNLEEALLYLKESGVQAVEIGCGGFPGKAHCDPASLLQDETKLSAFKTAIAKSGLTLAALSTHGNPVHPNAHIAKAAHEDFVNTCKLAQKLDVDTVITFSGCPGGSPKDHTPNWVTCPWPDDFLGILKYQWDEVLIPYWREAVALARSYGVTKIPLEMHPGFCVYNPETCMRLRNAVGPEIGANFDPSHLFWQGIDPVAAIRSMGDAIYHFHAKDTKIDALNTGVNGVLDAKPYSDERHRSWLFRTVGFGHDMQTWRDMISALRLIGYDGVISIEHEDSLMSINEGLQKAIAFLKDALMFEGMSEMWWA